jgi:1-acyl-sn-glycerol-3-phosphate acyltransferase
MAEPRRQLATRTGGFGYHAILLLIITVKRLFTRPRVTGLEHFPRSGGVLLVSNHLSIADPAVLTAVSPRPLVFMAKEELYRPLLARLILRWWGGSFPVRRGQNDVRAVRDALELIRSGDPVVVFPEGTRHPHGLGTAHPGVGYLATRAGCPVLPVALVGTERIRSLADLRRRPAFEVRIGEPLSLPSRGLDAEQAVNAIMMRIAALLPPERRGAYGTEPELASAV